MAESPELGARAGNELWALLNKAELAGMKLGWTDPNNVLRRHECEQFAEALQNGEYARGKALCHEIADALASLKEIPHV